MTSAHPSRVAAARSTPASDAEPARKAAWEIWLPVLFALTLTVPGLGQGSLVTDEALYAALARESLERWPALDLTLLGAPYGNKPPAGFWAMALSIATFGDGAFAARLPSALAGAACCGLVASLALRAFGRGAGFVAGLGLALTLDWVRLASQAGLDAMTLALGLLGVRLCVAARDHERARRLTFAFAAGAAFGLSAMIKGPLTITPLLVGLVLLRDPRAVGAALVTMLVVGGWWPLSMHYSAHGAVWRELVAREVAHHAQLDGGRNLSALARAALIHGAPSSLAALGGFYWMYRRFQRAAWIAFLWIAIAIVGAVLPSPTYSRYALPLFPAFAFVAGGAFRAWLADKPTLLESTLRVARRIVVGAGIVAIALPIVFGVRLHRDQAAIFALHRDELAAAFPVGSRVPIVGDANSAESGTIALHMRRQAVHLRVEEIGPGKPEFVLALGPLARGALIERGYAIEAALGRWAFLRRDGSKPLAAPADSEGEQPPSDGRR